MGNALKDQGMMEAAVKAYNKALAIKPDNADAYHNLGVALQDQGAMEAAIEAYNKALATKPNFAEAYNNIGNALRDQGKLEEAMEAYNKTLAIKPDNAEAYLNIGNALRDQGKLEEVIEAYNRALEIKPDYAEAYHNMGIILKYQGKLKEAIEAYKKALAIAPDYAEAYYNMGNALIYQSNMEAAIETYSKAIAIKSDYAEAYYNMGNALIYQSNMEAAIETYSKAIAIKPDYAEAYYNMGNALKYQGQMEVAVEAYQNALAIKPDYAEAYHNMCITLVDLRFRSPNQKAEDAIISILDRKTIVRPKRISHSALSLIKCQPEFTDLLSSVESIKSARTFEAIIEQILKRPLLLKLMSVCPLPDVDFERFLCSLRSYILENITVINPNSSFLKFQSALALQCFTNEYVYDFKESCSNALHYLEELVSSTLANGSQPKPHIILCLASFKALHEYDWNDQLNTNDALEDVIMRQVIEPNEEDALKSNIEVLGEINDEVSSKVREQYEENPYPRWVSLGLPHKPESIAQVSNTMKLQLSN